MHYQKFQRQFAVEIDWGLDRQHVHALIVHNNKIWMYRYWPVYEHQYELPVGSYLISAPSAYLLTDRPV